MISTPIFLPLLGALLALIWPSWGSRIASAALLGSAVIALTLLMHSQGWQGGSESYLQLGGWQSGVGIALRADGLAATFVAMSALLGGWVSLSAQRFSQAVAERSLFWPLWLLLFCGLHALFLAADLFNLYVTLELIGISAVALTLLAKTHSAQLAASRYLVLGLLGSMLFLAAVVLIYSDARTLDLTQVAVIIHQQQTNLLLYGLAAGLASCGLLIKSATFPFHIWLPGAHANALAPVSAVLSALVVKAAFYLLLRLWLELFAPLLTPLLANLFGALGALAVLGAGLLALKAQRVKMLAAYSTVAQMGYLLLFFPLLVVPDLSLRANLIAALTLLALTHAFAKAALFLCAGNLLQHQGHDNISQLHGCASSMPVTTLVLALCGVALIGLPPSGSFLAKWYLLQSQFEAQLLPWVLVVLVGTLLSAAYIFRLVAALFAQPPGSPKAASNAALRPESYRPWPALLMALVATAVLGLGANPLWQQLATAGGS